MPATNSSRRLYVFGNAWEQEVERLMALEAGWDPNTIEQLEDIGVGEGWRCLEVGAGAGSIAAWLCRRAGASGKVVATDLDTSLLRRIDAPNFVLRQHDIVRGEIGTGAFDLVHARLLLEHLPAADVALDRLIASLKLGGWLVVEDFDHITFLPDGLADATAIDLWQRFLAAFERLADDRGIDLTYGRGLHGLLEGRGLKDVVANGRSSIERGGSHLSRALSLSIDRLAGGLQSTGEMSLGDVAALRTLLNDPRFRWQSQLMVSARGRRR